MPYNSIYKPGLFSGQTVVITGGGSGIGRCTAHELSALGAGVALVGRNPDKLAATAQEIEEDGGTVSTHICDIRDEETVRSVIAAILDRHGRIDGLVNNAGGQYVSLIRDMKTKGFEAVVRSNLIGGFIFSREVYVSWMEKNGGSIVNMLADMHGGWPFMSHSGASRAGMLNFTESAAAEWGHAGVRVNAVAPGSIISSGPKKYIGAELQPFKNLISRIPLQRRGTESETSSAIVYLLSPGAAYITGAVIRIDGGAPTARQIETLPASDKSKPYDGLHRPGELY